GPYVPTSWNPTASLQLTSNESYWDYDSLQLHSIEQVLGMDPTAAQVSFQSGELDITIASDSAEGEAALEDSLVVNPGFSVQHLRFMCGGREAMRGVRGRRARSMARDREAFAALSPKSSVVGPSLVPGNVVDGWDESLASTYHVDAARALMSEAR